MSGAESVALAVPRATLQERRPHIREAEGEPRSSVRSSFAARSLKKKLKNNRKPGTVERCAGAFHEKIEPRFLYFAIVVSFLFLRGCRIV